MQFLIFLFWQGRRLLVFQNGYQWCRDMHLDWKPIYKTELHNSVVSLHVVWWLYSMCSVRVYELFTISPCCGSVHVNSSLCSQLCWFANISLNFFCFYSCPSLTQRSAVFFPNHILYQFVLTDNMLSGVHSTAAAAAVFLFRWKPAL